MTLDIVQDDLDEEQELNNNDRQEEQVGCGGNPSIWRQVFACFSICTLALTLGASMGFSGVAIPQLQNYNVTGFALTDDEISWFASLQTFAMVPTCVLGGWMGQVWGRKKSLMIIAPLFTTGFALQAAAYNSSMLLIGRFVTGMAGGLACGPTATYISEVPTANFRTTFGSGISGFNILGVVLIFTLGAFFHWRILATVSACLPVFAFLLMLIIPESPAWYVTKGRFEEASKAMQWLRGPHFDIRDEMFALRKSFYDIEQSQKPRKSDRFQHKIMATLSKFTRPDVYKPFFIILIAAFLQQFSGMSTVSYYAVSVLMGAGSSVNEYLAAIIFGLMRLFSQILGSFLLIRFKRRHMLVISCIYFSLSMALFGTSAYLHHKKQISVDQDTTTNTSVPEKDAFVGYGEDESGILGYLPLISVIMVALTYHLGLGPIPWSYMAELYPLDVRSFMSGVGNCTSNLYIALVVKTFPYMVETITMAGTYWFFSSVSLLMIVFTLGFLPETKDKGLHEISEGFSKKSMAKTSELFNDEVDENEVEGPIIV